MKTTSPPFALQKLTALPVRFAALSLLALAACGSPAAAPTQAAPSATAEAAATPTTEPTAETLPASLQSHRDTLEDLGYTLRHAGPGWELASPQGQIILTASDTRSIEVLGLNNEMFTFPEQAFGITETIGAGMEKLLTLTDAEGNITHTFLARVGYWAPLFTRETDPRAIDSYPLIPFEAIASGQLAQTEALSAEQFPEGTFVPYAFAYVMRRGSQSYSVLLQDWGGEYYDQDYRYHTELVNKENDYRRWVSYYRTISPLDGAELIVGVEQVLMPDGKTSLFLPYLAGDNISHTQDVPYNGTLLNLIDSVFLARTEQAKPWRESLVVRPVIFTARHDDGSQFGGSFTREQNNVIPLYNLPENNPASILEGLEETFRTYAETTGTGTVTVAGGEVAELHYIGLSFSNIQNIRSDYFNTP